MTEKRLLVFTSDGAEQWTKKGVLAYPKLIKQRLQNTFGFTAENMIQGLQINIKPNGFWMWAFQRTYLSLNTYWKIGKFPEGDFLYPCFNPDDKESTQKTLTWDFTPWGTLWVAGNFTNAYLVAKVDTKLYQLPLPNIYSDSRLCLGKDFSLGETITTIRKKVETRLDESLWNTDLYEAWKERNASLFSFHLQTMNQKSFTKEQVISMLQPMENQELLWLQ